MVPDKLTKFFSKKKKKKKVNEIRGQKVTFTPDA